MVEAFAVRESDTIIGSKVARVASEWIKYQTVTNAVNMQIVSDL